MRGLAQRLVLFVCSGDTSRSPMAQALCNDEIPRRLGLSRERHDNLPLRAVSAGLTARPGRPLSEASQSALQQLGVSPHLRSSQEVKSLIVSGPLPTLPSGRICRPTIVSDSVRSDPTRVRLERLTYEKTRYYKDGQARRIAGFRDG
jgi:hypothetical protein